MSKELKEKIKNVMARRYNSDTGLLDLSQFHNDEGIYSYWLVNSLQ